MTEFKDLVQLRRSHRKFSEQEVDADDLKLILRAALMAPTSKSQRAWQFVVVEDKLDMEKLADAKNMGSQFLKGAPVAIVVLGDPMQNDCWVEDGSSGGGVRTGYLLDPDARSGLERRDECRHCDPWHPRHP